MKKRRSEILDLLRRPTPVAQPAVAWADLHRRLHFMRTHDPRVPLPSPTIRVADPFMRGHEGATTWWPTIEIEAYMARVHARGYLAQGVGYKMSAAAEQTAAMFAVADNAEEIAAIWIAASLFDLDKQRPANWDVEVTDLQSAMWIAVRGFLCDRGWENDLWHHASKGALPVDISRLLRITNPKTVEHLMDVINAHVGITFASWRPVCLEGPTKERP